ncbi:hypothetical protein GCM10009544_29690 [Streptomyces stramineus]|uniref:Uncharacterized protein n=1 Tax=Streptomyces stramineus TaxID=173861 RepID=A0ABP3JVP3_9ACTN
MPNSMRPRETYSGAKPSVPSLMKRKLHPQMRVSTPKRILQSRAGRPRWPGGAEAVPEGIEGGEAGVLVVRMSITMT